MHKTELSKDNKDGAYKGKVNHTDAKWETSDKVSTAWNSWASCSAVAEKGKSPAVKVLTRFSEPHGEAVTGCLAVLGPSHSASERVGRNMRELRQEQQRNEFDAWLVEFRKMREN